MGAFLRLERNIGATDGLKFRPALCYPAGSTTKDNMMQPHADFPVLKLHSLDPIQAYKSGVSLRRNHPSLEPNRCGQKVLVSLPDQIYVEEWEPESLIKHVSLARLEITGVVKDGWVSVLFAELTSLPLVEIAPCIQQEVACHDGQDTQDLPPAPSVAIDEVRTPVFLSDVMPMGPHDLAARLADDIARIAAQASTYTHTPAEAGVASTAPDINEQAADAFANDEIEQAPDAPADQSGEPAEASQDEDQVAEDSAPTHDAVDATLIDPASLVDTAPVIDSLGTVLDTVPSDAVNDEQSAIATQQCPDDAVDIFNSDKATHTCDKCLERAMDCGEDLVPTLGAGKARTYRSMLRTGQVCENADGDLILVGSQATGSILRATGSVHVYGRASGAIKAGQRGDTSARIYVSNFNAQLVDIAGRFQSFEATPADLKGRLVEIWLEDEVLLYQAL